MRQSELQRFTSWLGKRSYKARLERLGLDHIQAIARENGKKGGRPKGTAHLNSSATPSGRPKGSGKKQSRKGGK